jgi:macrolide transport system ATP-binding/permease protein
LRTFLTMLGIIIGIASMVSVVALGQGSSRQVLDRISSMGTNTIDIRSGQGFGDERAGRVQTLVPTDADALSQQPYADSVTPVATSSASLCNRNVSATGTINGVGAQFFRVRGYNLARGVAFDEAAVRSQSQDVVIDENTQNWTCGTGWATSATRPAGKRSLPGRTPSSGAARRKSPWLKTVWRATTTRCCCTRRWGATRTASAASARGTIPR